MKLTSKIIGLAILAGMGTATSASAQCLGLTGVSAPIICADPALRAQEARVQSLTAGLQNADTRNMPGLRTNDGWREQHEQCHDANCARYSYDYRISRLEELTSIARQSEWRQPAPEVVDAPVQQQPEHRQPATAPDSSPALSSTTGEAIVSSSPVSEQPTSQPDPVPAADEVVDFQSTITSAEPPAQTEAGEQTMLLIVAVLGLIGVILYALPSIVAFMRGHAYRWVILPINLVAGWTLLGWVGSMVWAIWPAEKALLDPVVGSVTGVGDRNIGDALGEVDRNRDRVGDVQSSAGQLTTSQLDQLERLGRLKAQGVLTEDEFARQRAALMA